MKKITKKDYAWQAYVAAIHAAKLTGVYCEKNKADVEKFAADMMAGRPEAAAAYSVAAYETKAAMLGHAAAMNVVDATWAAYNSFQ